MFARASSVRIDQQVDMFIAGLVDLIHLDMELHNPSSPVQAMSLARAFEKKIQISSSTQRGYGSTSNISARAATTLVTLSVKVGVSNPFVKKLTRAAMVVRRANGLCYNCDDPYVQGHQCKKLFWLEVEDGESGEVPTDSGEPAISLHAITGKQHANTMQLQVVIDKKLLLSLVDSGSTHNFISSTAAQRLNLPILQRRNLNISVVNGEKISSFGICTAVQFYVVNHSFCVDLYVISLDAFDIVLGIKWLQTLGPILRDFTLLTMSFQVKGKQIILHGQQLYQPQLHLLQDSKQGELEKVLVEFKELFQEPVHLPPLRSCDHRICLLPGTGPVVVRPYPYPHFQKDEIEKQCDQMLQQGIIRPSRSPFSSPVLLVRKHDETLRFCVDYRELNAKTVKDKFHIPVVEELLE
ncbi:hypothetical protein KY285_010452 [Solanum tuberosum]|nr:hypothetical protein KY289_011007 [Solanum tuberosum]KAH0734745.1 hypothetical protein KY285_010452 [Solanum tuberosum]